MAAAMPLGDSAPNISVVPRPGLSTSVPSASVTLPYTLYSDKLFENLVKRAQSGDAPVTVELKNHLKTLLPQVDDSFSCRETGLS